MQDFLPSRSRTHKTVGVLPFKFQGMRESPRLWVATERAVADAGVIGVFSRCRTALGWAGRGPISQLASEQVRQGST